ncbi:hypothetical protein L1N85_11410 [Paenibacillus alkaliterrae]|uniref:hypothetical protein n=1 Tax=Paenibacillus alkaliterrae TaxID=320909 RepID=UPI001F484C1F|nr:hypothetical protein [Paenibacillus alkaliterrae]MCF2939044.1 hypothetical protein [Paenibacillus alkaliterrae]
MIDLTTIVNSRLVALAGHSRVYLESAPQDIGRNDYITFWMPTSLENVREDFTLEVDIWDAVTRSGYDPDAIDNLSKTIDGNGDIINPTGLNRYEYRNPGVIHAKFYRINRSMIPDPDSRLRRRQLRYQVQVYFK